MSVALELEYETFYPKLRVVSLPPRRVAPSPRIQRRRVILALVVVALLVLLMLPIRALAGQTLPVAGPTAGQQYVVHNGDTLASIADRVGGSNVAGLQRQLAREVGSTVVVPGEHLLIP